MNAYRLLGRRMSEPDAQQYLALYLITLLFALMATWPTPGSPVNDAWFSLAYARAAVLGLLGLGYGASLSGSSRTDQLLTGAMLALFALLALPLEIGTYAASYPATPLGWVLALPPLTALAMFGLGLLLGNLLGLIRLKSLVPIIVPAILGGMVAVDVSAGMNVLNPFTAAVSVSLPHLMVLLVGVAALTAVLAWRRKEGSA